MGRTGVVAVSCNGLHCAGCGGGSAVPVVALAAVEGFAWVAAHIIEVAVTSAACGALALAAVAALMRWTDRRDARRAAARPLWSAREVPAVTPAAAVRVAASGAPAIENHYHIHLPDVGEQAAARIIRQALPGTAGESITERN
jgi:hypothetical protein